MGTAPALAVVGITCFIATTLLMPMTKRVLTRRGVVDVPNPRSSHSNPTPRGGGVACIVGALIATALAWLLSRPIPIIALAACLALAVVGLLDDVLDVSAIARLGAQIGIGALLGAATGGLPLSLLGAFIVPLTVNVVNFMDGINGISALTVCAWSLTVIISLRAPAPVLLIAVLAISTSLAFLPWNAPHAKMFLGDSGSYFFGALIAAAVILSFASGPGSLQTTITPLALYIFDVSLTLVRRALRGKPLMEAHREHLYQLLQRKYDTSHLRVALAMGLAAFGLGTIWLLATPAIAVFLTSATCALYAGAALRPPSRCKPPAPYT